MILIVDDDPNFLENARAILGTGRQFCFASNTAHAMTLLDTLSTRLGVALVDLDLPGENGFELIAAMHQRDPMLPIIAISGVLSDTVLSSATAFGASDTLCKPITGEWHTALNRLWRKCDSDQN